MKILAVVGRFNYGDKLRGEGYEHSNFLPDLKRAGNEVELFDSFSRDAHRDFAELNKSLIERVVEFKPNVILTVLMGYEVWLETLCALRSSGAFVINWGTDDSWKYNQFSRFVAPFVDAWVTTSHIAYNAAVREGIDNFYLSQWAACATKLESPRPALSCKHEVTFIGSSYGNRPHWIRGLRAEGINVSCFGNGWPSGAVSAEDVPRLINDSLVTLNFADSGLHFKGLRPYRSKQIKARVFEVPGAGGCLFTEDADHLDGYFIPDHEIGIFRSVKELAQKVKELRLNPERRDAMALAGYQRVVKEHTYEERFRPLLELAHPPRRSNTCVATCQESAMKAHRINLGSRILRSSIVAPCKLVFGATRGPRAARRIVFELSWRLAGRHTYTASGLPGRLFYRES